MKTTIKSENAHLVYFAEFLWLLRASEGCFCAVYHSPSFVRAVLYYVNGKVGSLKWNLTRHFEECTSKTSLQFAGNSSTRLPAPHMPRRMMCSPS